MVIPIGLVPVALAILAANLLNFHEVLLTQPEQGFSRSGGLTGILTFAYGLTDEAGAFLYSVYDDDVILPIGRITQSTQVFLYSYIHRAKTSPYTE